MSFGELLSMAVDAALFRVGPWMSSAPANLTDAYRSAGARRSIAATIIERFGPALHLPLDVSVQEWWHSGSPEVEWFTRPRFRRFDDVYGAGQFTFAGMWTVSTPPPEVHRYLISSWELEPDPVTRWHLPIEQDVRVWEIHRPADWVRLVTSFPAPGRPYDGWELPGLNQDRRQLAGLLAVDGQHAARVGAGQLVPDWAAVAAEFDGVHLSWGGFLTAEGFVSDLAGGEVTMLRYWVSERTLWLRDVFGEAVPLAAPHSGIPDVEVGIDVRVDMTRSEQDRRSFDDSEARSRMIPTGSIRRSRTGRSFDGGALVDRAGDRRSTEVAHSGMNLFRDDHRVDVGGHEIGVTATTGLVHARWSLSVDGVEADAAAAAGDFSLHATLPDGTSVSAKVHQSLLGPTRVTVIHDGNEVGSMKGFVA